MSGKRKNSAPKLTLEETLFQAYQPLTIKQPGEMDRDDAAALWKCSPNTAKDRLRRMYEAGQIGRRIGLSAAGQRMYFYRVRQQNTDSC